MKHLSVIVPKGLAIVDTILGTVNLFQLANNYHEKQGFPESGCFEIDLVGLDLDSHTFNSFFSVSPTKTIDDIKKTDLIVIPGLLGDMKRQVELNLAFVDWIRHQRIRNHAELASLCRGAFLLARTGMMNGKTCATHWLTHDAFREMFPEVELLPDKVINEDNGIYSSGGAYSFLNLLLYLIEKYYGRENAIWCSKVSEIEFDRVDQNQFIIFNGQKDHVDEDVKKAQNYIEAHFSEKISVEELADQAITSTRNFVRRFKKATKNTPIEYIQRVRIENAKKKLESSTMNVLQVMLDSGYNDDKTFRTIFKRYAGLTPLEYRKKYNREMAYA